MPRKILKFISIPRAWITLLSLVWAVVFAFDLLPILRGGYDWEWHYKPVLERFRIAPLIVGVLVYILIGLWLRRRPGVGPLLTWALLGGIGLALAAVHARGDVLYRLYSLTVSGRASGWHMAAARIQDLSSALANWSTLMMQSRAFSSHIDHSPPGMVIVYYAASHLLDRLPALSDWMAAPLRWQLCQYITGYTSGQYAAAWLGILTPVWASLTVVPLYYLAQPALGEDAARWSILWWPLVPSLLVFAPLPYTSFALPAVAAMALLASGLRTGRMLWIACAGALLSAASFFNFVFAPLLLLAGLTTLGMYWLRNGGPAPAALPWHWPFQVGAWFAAGLSLTWLIFAGLTKASLSAIWQTAQLNPYEVSLIRPYFPFLAWNLNDFFMFVGWPLALLAGAGTWAAIRRLSSRQPLAEGDLMVVAAALTLALIDLSGTPRGETGRTLMFLAPWVLLAAASVVQGDRVLGGLVTVLQGVALVVMVVCLQVLAPEFKARAAPVAPEPLIPLVTAPSQEVGAVFDDTFRLDAAAGRIDSRVDSTGQDRPTLYLWLTWEDLKDGSIPYNYSLQLLTADGTPSGNPTQISPFQDSYPMTCWKPGEGNLIDRLRLQLPAASSGDWWVEMNLVDSATGHAAPIMAADGTHPQTLKLGPFEH